MFNDGIENGKEGRKGEYVLKMSHFNKHLFSQLKSFQCLKSETQLLTLKSRYVTSQ